MRRLSFIALAMVASSAFAIDGFNVQSLWNNNTGTFTHGGTFPSLTMTMSNQNNTTTNNYGERLVGWLSADGGATTALIDGHKDFSLFWTMKLSTDVNATRDLEGGLLMKYDNHRGFVPESQFYATTDPNGVRPNNIRTSADWVLPGWDFVANNGATMTAGSTVRMGIEYDYDDGNPANSVQRLTFGNAVTPWLNGNWGGPIYDEQMQLGFYFQPLVEANNSTHTSTGEFNLESFTGTIVPEPGTFVALGLGALALVRRRRNK